MVHRSGLHASHSSASPRPSAISPGWAGRLPSYDLLVVALAAAIALLVLYAVGTERAGVFKDDTRHYGLMAQDPTYPARAPYTLRVLTPLLVYLLPFDVETGFTIVTLVALWLTAVALYLFLRALELERWPAGAGVALFLLSGVTVRALTTPTYVDPLTYLTEVAGLYFLLTRREAWFALTLLLGVLNRETMLLLVPVYLLQLRAEGRLGRRDLPRVALVLGLPVLALGTAMVVKLLAASGLATGVAGLAPPPRTFIQTVPTWQELADVYAVFGAAWLLAALNLGKAPPILRRAALFGLLVVLQLSVSRGDESRNLSHLMPVVIPLAALEFRRFAGARAAGLALLVSCAASAVNFRWALVPVAGLRYLIVAVGTLAAAVLVAWGRARLSASSRNPSSAPVP